MEQPTFADLEYQGKKRKTPRELFLERMDGLIPWQKLEDRIRPRYPKVGGAAIPTHCRLYCESTACSCSTTPAFAGAGSQ